METNNKIVSINLDKKSNAIIWFNRVVIVIITFLFAVLGFKNIIFPIESAATSDITLESANAVSEFRVIMGAIPFAFAIIIFSSIFSKKTMYRGILTAFILVFTVTFVRAVGSMVDGVAPFLLPEIMLTILSGTGLFLETERKKYCDDSGKE